MPDHFLYGLKALESADIGFAWKCNQAELGGCLAYELRRQIAARVIWRPGEHHPKPVVEILKTAWLAHFSRPWPELTTEQKVSWIGRYNPNHPLPFGVNGQDPAPDLPGDLYTGKFDWDLSDPELCRGFKLALEKLRPRPPIRVRTESVEDQLTAIAAQRIIDCRGEVSTMKFAEKLSADLASDDPLFAKEVHLTSAAKRYRVQEAQFVVGPTKSGSLDIAHAPAAYGRSVI